MIAPTSAEAKNMAQAMLSFAVALGARPRHEVYISMPITTGHIFVEWRRQSAASVRRDHPQYRELHREAVVNPNIARTVPLVERLRRHFPDHLVINPAGLADLEMWEQPDYHYLWCETIRRFAEVVVFADGWEFSRGCVAEFVTAVQSDVRLLDERLAPIETSVGNEMILSAINSLENLDEDTADLRDSLAQLGKAR